MANPEIDNYVDVKQSSSDVWSAAVAESQVTKQDFEDLKSQVNDSFAEVANMFLELQSGLAQLYERIEIYNRKSSHKL